MASMMSKPIIFLIKAIIKAVWMDQVAQLASSWRRPPVPRFARHPTQSARHHYNEPVMIMLSPSKD
jgi:hypothetical protein